MLKYTASVREWMSADPKNIIAIHCKGGKGAETFDSFYYYLASAVTCCVLLIRTHRHHDLHLADRQ